MNNDKKLLGAEDMTEHQNLPAGCFSSWLRRTRKALVKENGADVPCGKCTACCTSSYFIHIKPEETETLARIPGKLLFAAPGLPKGNVLLGYDKNGHCPMLIDGRCSIYAHRPLTCRNYDCRIFTAVGIAAGDDDKALITRRARQWKFTYPTQCDRDEHAAVQAAAMFVQEHPECFPAGVVPSNPSQLAILAIQVYDVFIKLEDESAKTVDVSPDMEIAKAIIKALEKFEAGRDMTSSPNIAKAITAQPTEPKSAPGTD